MKSRRYRKRKPKMKIKTRRGGHYVPFMAVDLWGGLQDSFYGTVNTLAGAYPPPTSSILSQ
jgi:hypothetical protein